MSTAPTVAAVVVNHNYARYLPEAVDSLLGQDVPFDEVVVVDDGSTDDSRRVLDAYRTRVKVLEIANGGQLGACRAGLAATTADYVYFLDADDTARPELVATIAPVLGTRPVKVQFQLEGVDGAGAPLDSVFPTFPRPYPTAAMRADNDAIGFYLCPPTSGNVYARGALDALPLDRVDQRDFIDGPPTLALPHVGEIASVSAPLARYRVHGGNHSQWSEPTAELLAHEVEWFGRRWAQVVELLGHDPRRGGRPLYLVERELMIAALGSGAPPVRAVGRLLRGLPATHLPARQKVLLAGWALGLLAPLPRWRRAAVRARRSPLNRAGWLRTLVGFLVRGRKRTNRP
jgi:glycosyltransferase involved in cell wall biosynthesis